MALARVQYQQAVADNRNFTVPMPYISRDHIKVSVDGVDVSYSWLNSGTIQLATAPALGDIIDVRRETERNKLLVDFHDASTITEEQLDLSAQQTFYIAQEAFDATGGTMGVANDGSFSAGGRRITNVGYPTKDLDAATVEYVKAVLASGKDAHEERVLAEEARSQAQDARHAARASELAAENSAGQLEEAVTLAEQSAGTASTASQQASLDADAAQQARTGAESAKQEAANAASSASTSATTATQRSNAAQTSATNAANSEASAADHASRAEQVEQRVSSTTTMDFINFELDGPNLIAHFQGYGDDSKFQINDNGELEVIL